MPAQRTDVKFTINAAFFQEIKDDHQQLNLLLGELSGLIENREALPNHRRKLCRLLGELRDQLAFHFALEEAYGYFEDAIDCSPWLHTAAGNLLNQHGQLYLEIGEIADRADDCCRAEDNINLDAGLAPIVDDYEAFRKRLGEHESAEMKLILDAMNRDFGGGD